MWFIWFYIVSLFLVWFIIGQCFKFEKYDPESFRGEGSLKPIVFVIVVALIPFINIIGAIALYIVLFVSYKSIEGSDIIEFLFKPFLKK